MKLRVSDFNLEATLESGQVFGFNRRDKSFSGLLGGKKVEFRQDSGGLYAEGEGAEEKAIRHYFDLDRDLTPVYRKMSGDEALAGKWEKLRGLRLIRQDSWEALACFILSSNNNVKRIQGIWKNLSTHFGERAGSGLPFPAARAISGSHEKLLRMLGLGYRAPFLLYTARFVANNPFCLEAIREADYEEAKERVLCFPGIGEKVADCVLLYGFQKYEAFPVDVWILRIMRKLYFRNRSVSEDKVRRFAQKRWGADAGYIQQYLFHGARTGLL